MTRNIEELEKRISVLSRVRKLSVDTKAIKFATNEIKNLQREKDKLEGKSPGGGGSGGRNSVWDIAAGVSISQYAPRAMQAFTGFFRNAVEASMEREQQKISLGVLMGGEKQGDAMLENVTNMAARTPFGTNDLLKATQTMLGFGVAQEKVLPIMNQLGDISGGNVERFQSLTLAFSQMSSTGRLMGQDLLQMVNAGFNPLKTISEMTGKSMGQLKKDMEAGKISAELVMKAMSKATSEGGLYYGMMDKQSKTTAGRLSTLKDEYNEMAVALGDRFKPAIDGVIGGLSNMVGSVKKWFEVRPSEKIQREAFELRLLQSELNSANLAESRRSEILTELNNKHGITLKNIDDQKQAYADMNIEINKVVSSLENMAIVTAMKEGLKDIDDEITKEVAFNAKNYRRAFQAAERVLGKDAVTDVRMDASLDPLGKVKKLDQLRKEKGDYSNDATTISESVLYMNRGRIKIDDLQKDKSEQQAILEESMDAFGLNGTGRRPRRKKKNDNNANENGSSTSTSSSGTSVPSISGGSKITHLTINIDSLIKGGVNFQQTTMKESTAQMKDAVTETLLSAVNDANIVAGNNN